MTIEIGSKVRLTRPVENYPIGIFDIGLTGTLMNIDREGSYWVKLDTHFPELDEWENELQLWDYSVQDGASESPLAYLEKVS